MTQRKRTIYQNDEVFISNVTGVAGTGGAIAAGETTQLHRVQNVSYETSVSRTDVNEFGVLARLDSLLLEAPSVTVSFDYLLADGHNETGIGLEVRTGSVGVPNAISGILANLPQAEKNIYVETVSEGLDAHGISPQSTSNQFFSFGNCFITNYSLNLAVGELPTASTSWECSNLEISYGAAAGVRNPALIVTGQGVPSQYTGKVVFGTPSTGTLSVAALRPGDITIDFGTDDLQIGGPVLPGTTSADTSTAMHVNSVSIEIPLSRTPQTRLGSHFPFSRELDVPIAITMSVQANLADIVAGSLFDLVCSSEETRDIVVTLNDPCSSTRNLKFTVKGAILDSQNYSLAVGDNAKTVELTFSAQIGGGNDQTRGLFIEGKRGEA